MRRKWLWLILAVLMVGLTAYSAYSHYRLQSAVRKADLLLAEARTWRLNQTTGPSVDRFTQQFDSRMVEGDCSRECSIEMSMISSPPEWVVERDLLYKASHLLGGKYVRFWFRTEVAAGRLQGFSFGSWIFLQNAEQLIFNFGPMTEVLIEEGSREQLFARRPNLTSLRRGKVLGLRYTDKIVGKEWVHAINFNTACATRVRTCTELHDYMPQAWAIWEKQRAARGTE